MSLFVLYTENVNDNKLTTTNCADEFTERQTLIAIDTGIIMHSYFYYLGPNHFMSVKNFIRPAELSKLTYIQYY